MGLNTKKVIHIRNLSHQIRGEVNLPTSKSESNRLLILQALSRGDVTAGDLSEARDTKLLQAALNSGSEAINIQDAGTDMRFLTAYYCAIGQHKILTGSIRMCERPIGILVNALRELGFNIKYLRKEGFPPLEIIPADISILKNEVSIAGNVSSQYISALLMIAPVMPDGLTLHFTSDISSRPYIELTLDMMMRSGIKYLWKGNSIKIAQQSFQKISIYASPDWSAASYWYSMAALSDKADFKIKGLTFDKTQGDKVIAKWMRGFGVETKEEGDGLRLLSSTSYRLDHPAPQGLKFNFTDHPDLAQTVIVLCAARNINATFTGLESLRIKETDRIAALQNELLKFGVRFAEVGEGRFGLIGTFTSSHQIVQAYDDHRMAMAFAPLALFGEITIENPQVVEKSYPSFWEEMKEMGFEIKE